MSDQRFILAEYCGGPFYKGWHLYERSRADGSLNHDGCGWLRRGAQALYDLQRLMPSLPAPENETAYSTLAEIKWHGRLVAAFVERHAYMVGFADAVRAARGEAQTTAPSFLARFGIAVPAASLSDQIVDAVNREDWHAATMLLIAKVDALYRAR